MSRTLIKRMGGGNKWAKDKTGIEQFFLGTDYQLDAPYDVSPDGKWIASAVYPSAGFQSPTRQLVLIRKKEKQLEWNLELPYELMALTWSPSGNYLIVIYTEDVTQNAPWSFKDWFAGFIGHPFSYRTVRAAIYGLTGNQICEQLLKEKAPFGQGYVNWVPN